nr:PREDICTED: uncharacterized protein LOC106701923 [Latimeria chalumnae]|eukprot:XP_014339403.1 PREDICTED: uncharacterized protein LOC106701923 [Latimeria chalumnae]
MTCVSNDRPIAAEELVSESLWNEILKLLNNEEEEIKDDIQKTNNKNGVRILPSVKEALRSTTPWQVQPLYSRDSHCQQITENSDDECPDLQHLTFPVQDLSLWPLIWDPPVVTEPIISKSHKFKHWKATVKKRAQKIRKEKQATVKFTVSGGFLYLHPSKTSQNPV